MLAGALHSLLSLALGLAAAQGRLPRGPRRPHAATQDDAQGLWSFVEDHGDVIFPVMGLAIVALLFFGIRHGMRSSGDELRKRMHDKDEILRMTRSRLLLSADEVCVQLQVDRLRAAALLEELLHEGKLVEQRSPSGVANYRMKGL